MKIHYSPTWAVGLLLAGSFLLICQKELELNKPTPPVNLSKSARTGIVKTSTFFTGITITYQEISNELSKLNYYLSPTNHVLRLH